MVAMEEGSCGGRGDDVRSGEVRAYGFVAPGNGGEGAFVHADDLLEDKGAFSAGVKVESSRWALATGMSWVRCPGAPASRPGTARRYSKSFHLW